MVQFSNTISFEQIIDRLMERGPAITREDAIAVIRAYSQTIITLALEGNKVSTPLMSCGISIKGVFVSQTDTFNSSRHSIEATVNPGPEFKRLVREKGQVQQQEANKPQPNPLEYLDLGSGQRNGSISAGRVAQVNGHRLKFDQADPTQGIFFIAADGSESRASLMVKNTARQLIFEAPAALAAGDYTLEVRVNYGQGTLRPAGSTLF
ncbi:MAG: DUF4469 domain-containing protein [Anaerolineales bacterium]|nr:DUF4469 domain-containing protein [Anaerolineales bacterium]